MAVAACLFVAHGLLGGTREVTLQGWISDEAAYFLGEHDSLDVAFQGLSSYYLSATGPTGKLYGAAVQFRHIQGCRAHDLYSSNSFE